ncbi:YcaO-like family protein [Lysinibacillus xylanilyticus]|uniref:YcaO-like family protein n=1 Tax=Lysinibacillus xylanilyticus TaxID=582475 RepID=UPI00380A20DE
MLNYILKKEDSLFFDMGHKVLKTTQDNLINLVEKKIQSTSNLTEIEEVLWSNLKSQLSLKNETISEKPRLDLLTSEFNLIPIIYSLYDMGDVLNQLEDKTVLPILIEGNAIYLGPITNNKIYFKNFITRLSANDPIIKEKAEIVNISSGNSKIYYNTSIFLEYEGLLNEAIQRLAELNSPNAILVIEDGNISTHIFQSFFKQENLQLDLMDAVDNRLGIITNLTTESLQNKGVDIFVSVSTTSDYSVYDSLLFAQSNSGAGFNKESAEYSAIGESIERLAAGVFKPKTKLCTWEELDKEGVHPDKFILFSDDQYKTKNFPYNKFSEISKINWVKSINLSEGKEEYVPLSLVKLPYKCSELEERISPSISTGLALGQSEEEAILSGIFETIERDAFTISWFLKLQPNRKLKIEDYIHNFSDKCSRNYRVNVYDISLENLFNTVLVTIHDSITNNFMIGAATRFTLEEAVKKAFLEAAQGITYVEMLVRKYKNDELIENFNKINSFQKHAAFYSIYPHLRDTVGYLLDENYTFQERNDSSFEINSKALSHKDRLDIAIQALKENGFNINYVDLTTGEISNLGVNAAKIIIPGLQSLHGTHAFRYLNQKRLKKFGLKNEKDINIYPHPFP